MNKRPFSSITKEECIACAKIIKPTVFTVTPKWEVVEADKSVYDKGGSKNDYFAILGISWQNLQSVAFLKGHKRRKEEDQRIAFPA